MHSSKSISIGVVLLTLVAAVASPEHLLLLCVGGVLAAGVLLLWPPTDAPILLLPFGLQWLAVAVKPIQTAFTGQPLDNFGDFDQPLLPAAWLAIAGIAALGLGMWIGAGRSRTDWAKTLARDAGEWPAHIVLQISLGLIVVGSLLDVASSHTGGARQIFIGFSGMQNAGVFVLAYWCLKEGKALPVLAGVVALEIVFGMTGFFAGFRETLLVLLIAAAAARPRLGLRSLLATSFAFAIMLTISVFWTAIKVDYRDYLNEGAHEQVVTRPMSERLSYLGQAADEFNSDKFQEGLRKLSARLSYIDFLASTMKHVPEVVPYEHGGRLGGALLNIIEPRILFPDKPPTPNDSDITVRYTGLQLDLTTDTSISIGYLGELYVDFGVFGAIVGALVVGLGCGWAYSFIRRYRGIPLFFTYGICIMAVLLFSIFETDLVRFLGSAITAFAACLILQRLIAPQLLTFLQIRDARTRPT